MSAVPRGGQNGPVTSPREVVLLGSTGSIGTQAAEIVRRHPERFRVVGVGAGGGQVELLAAQALELGVDVVAVAQASAVQDLQLAFYAEATRRGYATGDFRVPKILGGPEAISELATWPADVVLNGVDGSRGLAPTLAALEAGRTVALANKETLVAGGPLVRAAAGADQLVPVDSEHSALAQCRRAGGADEVRRLVLTASGGPFRGRARAELARVTPEEALAHPTWCMGPVVTVNSATLVNKGLELIEAHELYGTPYAAIEVVVHPQSVLHSLVEFVDGSTVAQASPPDMQLPIALALGWPERVPDAAPAVDWGRCHEWRLEPLDHEAFPAVALARAAGEAGGCRPAVYNAANEECVAAFLAGRLPFPGIVDTVAQVLDEAPSGSTPGTVGEVHAAEEWARARTRERVAAVAAAGRSWRDQE